MKEEELSRSKGTTTDLSRAGFRVILEAKGPPKKFHDIQHRDDVRVVDRAADDERVEKVLICTPDKDLAQVVRAGRIVQFDRRNDKIYDVDDVIDKYGVPPESIPDWLGLVGDSADGFPGLPGWGARSAATVLARYGHIEQIPLAAGQWDITVRGGAKLAQTLADNLADALLFKTLATLALDAPTIDDVDELRWTGPTDALPAFAASIDAPDLVTKAAALAGGRS